MTDNPQSAPRVAFLGFCDRAEEITAGHPVFWRRNLLGVSTSRAFYVFPANLRGLKLAVAIYQPKAGDAFKLEFRGVDVKSSFDIVSQIASIVRSDVQRDATIVETKCKNGGVERGWAFTANPITTDVVVNSPGTYEVYLVSETQEQYIGLTSLAHLRVPPYTSEEITAIKSDPLGAKWVRMSLSCNSCGDTFKAYAGVDKSPLLESQGFRWNHDIQEDEFICSCGKSRISLIPIRTGLHGLLRRNVNLQTETDISAVRLYEQTALEQSCRELLKLIEGNPREEELQTFLESHPIFFHVFSPKKVLFKPRILTKYVGDFAVINERDELLLIEIERPNLRLLKKDGDMSSGLAHAFHQVRTWAQVLDDQRFSALEAMGLKVEEVAKVKSVVVAGRRPSDEKRLRMLRTLSSSEIELYTYEDLLKAVTELIKYVANL